MIWLRCCQTETACTWNICELNPCMNLYMKVPKWGEEKKGGNTLSDWFLLLDGEETARLWRHRIATNNHTKISFWPTNCINLSIIHQNEKLASCSSLCMWPQKVPKVLDCICHYRFSLSAASFRSFQREKNAFIQRHDRSVQYKQQTLLWLRSISLSQQSGLHCSSTHATVTA